MWVTTRVVSAPRGTLKGSGSLRASPLEVTIPRADPDDPVDDDRG